MKQLLSQMMKARPILLQYFLFSGKTQQVRLVMEPILIVTRSSIWILELGNFEISQFNFSQLFFNKELIQQEYQNRQHHQQHITAHLAAL